LKQFRCEDDSAEHVFLINMLLDSLPEKAAIVGRKEARKEDCVIEKIVPVNNASSSVKKL